MLNWKIKEPDKKINPKAWQKELDGLREKYQKTERPLSEATLNLAKMEVLSHNKRDLERILQNERSRREHFDIAELREITSYDELELDTLGDRKTALFLIDVVRV
nr:hypothetical protein [Butyrivibrio sp. NC3005]